MRPPGCGTGGTIARGPGASHPRRGRAPRGRGTSASRTTAGLAGRPRSDHSRSSHSRNQVTSPGARQRELGVGDEPVHGHGDAAALAHGLVHRLVARVVAEVEAPAASRGAAGSSQRSSAMALSQPPAGLTSNPVRPCTRQTFGRCGCTRRLTPAPKAGCRLGATAEKNSVQELTCVSRRAPGKRSHQLSSSRISAAGMLTAALAWVSRCPLLVPRLESGAAGVEDALDPGALATGRRARGSTGSRRARRGAGPGARSPRACAGAGRRDAGRRREGRGSRRSRDRGGANRRAAAARSVIRPTATGASGWPWRRPRLGASSRSPPGDARRRMARIRGSRAKSTEFRVLQRYSRPHRPSQ